LPINYN